MNTANFITEVVVTDPDSQGDVHVSMFKHEQSGGIFGIDSSYIEQNFEDDEDVIILDPLNFNLKTEVKLLGV